MKHYVYLILAMMVFLLALFFVANGLDIPLLSNPDAWMSRGGVAGALLGVGLLIVDVVLPVPASFVMMANGAVFGIGLGTLLSVVGLVGAGTFGFGIGRLGGPWLDRLVPETERLRADALLDRWGETAIIVTRPIPILAEIVSILAGASPMRWGRMLTATLVGSIAAALLYSVTGATALELDNPLLTLVLVLAVAGIFWFAGRRWGKKNV